MANNKTPKPPKQNDELLKGAFEENFPDFLRFLYPNAERIFDLNRGIHFMDKELLAIVPNRERKKGKRVADLLAKVYLKDGTEKWILVHTEIEAGSKEDFAFRLFQYHYRLLDRYEVPVETIAVFTGDGNQHRPSDYHHEVIDTCVHFRYRAYHIFDHSQEELLAMNNAFALIVLACQKALLEGKVPDSRLGDDRLTIAKALLSHNYDHDHIISFLVFLKNFLYINNVEINSIFDEQVVQLTGGIINMGVIEIVKRQKEEQLLQQGLQEGLQQGLQEGLQQGLQEGLQQGLQQGAEQRSAEVVESLILELGFSDEQAARIAKVTVDFVRKVRTDLNKNKKQ